MLLKDVNRYLAQKIIRFPKSSFFTQKEEENANCKTDCSSGKSNFALLFPVVGRGQPESLFIKKNGKKPGVNFLNADLWWKICDKKATEM